MPPTERRAFLQVLASTSFVALSGCASTDESERTDRTMTGTPGTPTNGTDVETLERKATRLITRWASGEYDRLREPFTERMKAQITTDQLRQIWSQLSASRGSFVSVTNTEYTTSQGFDVIVVTARFSQGQQRFTVAFDDQQRVAGLRALPPEGSYDPPAYAEKSAFAERNLTIEATENCSLGATLTTPIGDESVPGVVLVHGSGPHDRDETIGPNKPFRDLAWGLASRGVAVLRYQKRTGACETDPTEITLDSVVTDDALAAVSLLREQERVPADDVVVVGHSLGGMVAPRIAARDGTLAGIAMLAAPARPVPTLLDAQNEYIAKLDGTISDADQRFLDDVRAKTDRIRTLDIGPDETVFGKGRAWWGSLQGYEQVATAKQLSVPIYLLQGGRDYQVSPEADFGRWQSALAGRENVGFELYPPLDHLFMPGEGPSRPADYYEQDNVAEQVVDDLASWIDER